MVNHAKFIYDHDGHATLGTGGTEAWLSTIVIIHTHTPSPGGSAHAATLAKM